MNGAGATSAICPCGTVALPTVIFNPPGLTTIAYRTGTYADFRHALLQALPGESELSATSGSTVTQIWQPTAQGDLALQMMEWFAYLADVLTFYNQRIATQAYLLTADLPESPGRLIQLLGYRPRPALGSKGTLAALVTGSGPFTLPPGLAVQSKSGPGKQPQTFELDATATIAAPDQITAQAVPENPPAYGPPAAGNSSGSGTSGGSGSAGSQTVVWLAGKVSGIKVNDKLLLVNAAYLNSSAPPTQPLSDFAWIVVGSVDPAAAANGNPVTQITFTLLGGSLPANSVTQYRLMRSSQASPPWSYDVGGVVSVIDTTESTLDLAAIARGVSIGDLFLLDGSGAQTPSTLLQVTAYGEVVWYANGFGPEAPAETPPGFVVQIAIPHTELTFAPTLATAPSVTQTLVRYAFAPVGTLVAVQQPSALSFTGGSAPLSISAPPTFVAPPQPSFTGPSGPVLLQDASGVGAAAQATFAAGAMTLDDVLPAPPPSGLAAPINVLFNLLPVSQGKTVANEILGSGNALVAGQDFPLRNAPVTYFQDPASVSGDGFSSTVRVWVNGIEWSEVRSFYAQSAQAQIFVTSEDEAGATHVVFGDGANGARLPTGVNNVVATYRYGAGAAAPAPGTLTVVLQPQPGLKALVNPLAPTGGADADPPARIKQLAPASVTAFGRAVSLDDYRAIAASAPGVTQAQAALVFDPRRQRPCVTVWVAGDNGAQAAASSAIAGASDPNTPVVVEPAIPIAMTLSFTYVRDPKYLDANVQAGLTTALTDPEAGLFGVNVVGIGQAFYASQISAAALAVPGVNAIGALSFAPPASALRARFPIGNELRLSAGPLSVAGRPFIPGSRFGLAPALTVSPCVGERYDPGSSGYYVVTLGPLSAVAAAS